MKNITILFHPLIVGLLTLSPSAFSLPQMETTFHVVDIETGKPITNAVVQKSFVLQQDWHGTKTEQEDFMVDNNGYCTLSGETMRIAGGGASVVADGYYSDGAAIPFTRKNILLNRWEPWNPTIEVKMRPKKNPVPMIAERIESLKIPVWDESLGFDLEKGDWVDPHGKGKKADFFVNMHRRFEHSSDYDAVAEITFPNDGDGIQLYDIPEEFQHSSYQFPYEAPKEGYQDTLVLERHATLRETICSFNPDTDMYIFRMRTKKDEDGNIVSASYGRIDRRIEIGWGDVLDFEYHFNPVPNERSLEWNGENLLKK